MSTEIRIDQTEYVPGMGPVKLATVMFGALVFGVGLLWAWHPAKLWFHGAAAEAAVVYVEETKPGQEPVRLTSGKEVRDAEDPTRNAVYSYHVQFQGPSGELHEGALNYGHALRPQHNIGDTVNIRYAPANPQDLVVIDSIRTWTFALFFAAVGLLIVVSQWILFANANRSIPLESIEGVVAHHEQEES